MHSKHLGTPDQAVSIWRALTRGSRWVQVFPIVALAVFGTLFIRHLTSLDSIAIWAALTKLAAWQWIAALACTAISFRALGIYDILVHRVLNTGQTTKAARNAGMKAIAVSQTLGFGSVTSALVRWRCMPDMPAGAVLRLSVIVSVSFLVALAAISALVVPLSGLLPHSRMLIGGGIIAVLALALLARLAHRLAWIAAPVSGRTMFALLAATAADTTFAALALWVLWPEPIAFHLLFAAYLVALGAGLMSNAPGGVGAFDLTLLALLSVSSNPDAMAALLAFRVIYYALPAGLALVGLVRRPTPNLAQKQGVLDHQEAALLAQSACQFHHIKGPLMTLPNWGRGAVLGDLPARFDMADLQRSNSPDALYKCSAPQATQARRAGWLVLRCAREAWITPRTWTIEGAEKRQLRRALKRFERTALSWRETHNLNPLTPVAEEWARNHGGEKGHSMGRFCPHYLARQRVFAAFDGSRPIAFVSFHTGPVWTLDLIRHINDIPTGTMQTLIHAGIMTARDANADALSLAAIPALAPKFPFAALITAHAAGLHRFKDAFAPTWAPRYICAKTPLRLAITMVSLAYRIHYPTALRRPKSAHANDENYSFAPSSPS